MAGLARRIVAWPVLVLVAAVAPVELVAGKPTALDEYVSAADDSYAWTMREKRAGDLSLDLVSQTWHGIRWRHRLVIFTPPKITHSERVLLFITGGATGREPPERDRRRFGQLARLCSARVAVLYQVPNQPLLGNRFEDDLISETFLRHLKSGDPTWPLLFPMVKSAVRAMDAVQEVAKQKLGTEVTGFVVSGASKRGWTTWLTAAVDKRVTGLAPLVIDVLNFQVQMKHQKQAWGKYSKQIGDYTSKGLIGLLEKRPKLSLWSWVDPYAYRDRLSQPKLIVNGTNDPYWCIDALNNYWPALLGEKHVLYIPNAGHGLDGGEAQLLATLAAFFRLGALQRPLPKMTWKYGRGKQQLSLEVTSDQAPLRAELWTAHSKTRDFRKSKFTASELRENKGVFSGDAVVPAEGHVVLYGHLTYQVGDLRYGLSTPVQVK